MTTRRILPTLGILLLAATGLAAQRFDSEYEQLRGMVRDSRGHVYIGAVNVLYELDSDLNLLNDIPTGPSQDNSLCAPPQLADLMGGQWCLVDGEEMSTTDNYNQLILIDERDSHLITCGSVFQGTCVARNLLDISYVIPESAAFMPESHVVATDEKLKSVAFIADVEAGKQSMFIAGYLSADGEFTSQEGKKPGISNRHLINEADASLSFSFYTNKERSLYTQRSWHVKPLVEVTYVAAFADKQFAYFLFNERAHHEGSLTQTRIARTCLLDQGNTNSPLSDSTYTSYIEIPVSCSVNNARHTAMSAVDMVTVHGRDGTDSQMLVGTFSNLGNTMESAICVFSFDEMNKRLNDKVFACSRGEGVKKIKSEAREGKVPCTNSKTQCTDVCTCNIKNDNYPLEIEEPLTGQSVQSIDGKVLTVAANVVGDKIELFAGLQMFDEYSVEYSVEKYVIESEDRIHHVKDFKNETLSDPVLQIEVLREKDEILVLTEKSVFTQPISVCSQYESASCHECLQVKDPHCGWCEISAACTTEEMCTTDLWRTEGECTAISLIKPNMMSMGTQRLGNKVSITTNNRYPVGTPISCDFGRYGKKEASVADDGQISCLIPYLDPPIEGKHMVDFGLISGNIALASSEQAFTFFNCESYTSCSSCTKAGVGCGWCTHGNRCAQICSQVSSPDQCPTLSHSKTFIPAGVLHSLEVSGTNLPQPFGADGDGYQCVFDIDGEETKLPGTYVNRTKVICTTGHIFNSAETEGVSNAQIKVLWNSKAIESDRPPELEVYRCNVLGRDCSSCRANSKVRRCGWCGEMSKCLLQFGGYEVCQGSYSNVCVGLSIESFEPKHGPIEGGTLVTIKGTNLGSHTSDITSIKIAGLACDVQSEGFEVSRTVVCKTSPSGMSKHGVLEVETRGDQYILSQPLFTYKRYKVHDVSPRCGIQSGGTELTISGEELNIGATMSVIVAGTMCDVTDISSQKQVSCTTKHGVIGQTKLQVKIDGGSVSSPIMYEVVQNPELGNLSTSMSIKSGGIPVEVDFRAGDRVECVQTLRLHLESVNRMKGEGECFRSGAKSYTCLTPAMGSLLESTPTVEAHLIVDNHRIRLEPFVVHEDPVMESINNTQTDGHIDWPVGGGRKLVLNGKNLNKISGIEVLIGGMKVPIKVTEDHIVLTPPTFSSLKEHRAKVKKEQSRNKRDASRNNLDDSRSERETGDKKDTSEYSAAVEIKLGQWKSTAGRLYYTSANTGGVPYVAIIIPIVGFIVLVVVLSYVGMKYHRSQKSHRRTLKTVRMHMEKLEMRVANECKDAFTALQTHLTDMQGDVADIPFLPFSDFMTNVLFPGAEAETRDLLAKLSAPSSKVVETPALAQFRRLLKEKEFLQKFVEVVEADPNFDVANKCKMASLLVIVISSDMTYLTEVLFSLMEKLIEKFLAKKNHPQLLLRRTESVADKLLTHWLNYCCYNYLINHAGKSIFTLFSAIKSSLDLGPQDEVTYEAKSSLNNEKMLREQIDFKMVTGTVRDLNKHEHPVTLLTCDSLKQCKRKVIESVHRNKPSSQIPLIESFDLMYIRSGNTPVILRENHAPIVEGWRKLNTLSDYKLEDTCPTFAMIPLSTDSEHSSLSPQAERRKTSFLTTKRYRSKGNLITSGMSTTESEKSDERVQVYHLVKPNQDISETDTLLSTKMMSEVFLTRLLSTKGTLQPYVDDLFDSVFMSRDKVPPCIKYLFDFLERQAHRHNLLHNQAYIHTWKNNSLSLRFWMNILKNPHFLLDIEQTPTIDSSLNIVCGVFMDSCSTSDKGLTKDSPINKLLYAKDIPKYKKQVQIHYEQVSSLPRPSLDFLAGLAPTGLNITVAVSELLDIAHKYQKQLQSILLPDSPSLNLRFTSLIDPSLQTAHNMA